MQEIAEHIVGFGETSMQFFWVPFLIWTLISVFALLMFKLSRISHPLFHYHTRLALLLSLPFVFLFSHIISFSFFSDTPTIVASFMLTEEVGATGSQPDGLAIPTIHWPFFMMGITSLAAALLATWALFRLLVNYYAQEKLRRKLFPVSRPDLVDHLGDTKNIVLPNRRIAVYVSPEVQVPLTFGWLRPVIVLPTQRYDDESLKTVLLHEMVHVKRYDYLVKWLQECIRAVFLINPLVWYLSHEIDDHREISCDTEVLGFKTTSPKHYATLLLTTADNAPGNPLFSSMAQPKSKLMKRIKAMNTYTSSNTQEKNMRTVSLIFSFVLGGLVIFLSACDLKNMNLAEPEEEDLYQISKDKPEFIDNDEDGPLILIDGDEGELDKVSPLDIESVNVLKGDNAVSEYGEKGSNGVIMITTKQDSQKEAEIFKVVEEMPEPLGGIQAIYENLTYPDDAKRAGIEGRVSVQFTVNTDGTVKDAVILRGIGGGADEAAVDAIQNTKWNPGKQRGVAVPVRFVYTIQFRL